MVHGIMAFSLIVEVRIDMAQVRTVSSRAVGYLALLDCGCRHGREQRLMTGMGLGSA
jgi:hypothetical protein